MPDIEFIGRAGNDRGYAFEPPVTLDSETTRALLPRGATVEGDGVLRTGQNLDNDSLLGIGARLMTASGVDGRIVSSPLPQAEQSPVHALTAGSTKILF